MFLLNIGIFLCLSFSSVYPLTLIEPVVGTSSLSKSLISVDLPEPLPPTMKTNSPFLISMFTFLRAGLPLTYSIDTFSSEMMLSAVFLDLALLLAGRFSRTPSSLSLEAA